MEERTHCDMCSSLIVNNKCCCGKWFSPEDDPHLPMKQGLEIFHSMNKMTFTADIPELGCAVVYFRGDYNQCKHVERFICKMKGREFF